MRDRVPLKPGRVKITPEGGGAAYYATMERADQPTQEGDPLNKATLLKDATAALFGLGTSAVPDNVLAYVGKYNQHWWRRRKPETYKYVEKKEFVSSVKTIIHSSQSVQYSKSIQINQSSGEITLVSPTSLSCGFYSGGPTEFMSTLCTNSPLYLIARGNDDYDTLYYIPANATYTDTTWADSSYTFAGRYNSSTRNMYVGLTTLVEESKRASIVTSDLQKTEAGEWEYLQSSSRNAYPDSGEQNGYEYQYLGIPFDNAVTAPKIATGSYVGTGKYGSSNPNSLTFDFEPKFFACLHEQGKPFLDSQSDGVLWINGYTSSGNYNSINFTLSGNTLKWSSDSAGTQLNNEGKNYYYFAIG